MPILYKACSGFICLCNKAKRFMELAAFARHSLLCNDNYDKQRDIWGGKPLKIRKSESAQLYLLATQTKHVPPFFGYCITLMPSWLVGQETAKRSPPFSAWPRLSSTRRILANIPKCSSIDTSQSFQRATRYTCQGAKSVSWSSSQMTNQFFLNDEKGGCRAVRLSLMESSCKCWHV